jgi:hypothetical protein
LIGWAMTQQCRRAIMLQCTQLKTANALKVRPAGLEPATFGFEVRDSIQLSYERLLSQVKYNTPP